MAPATSVLHWSCWHAEAPWPTEKTAATLLAELAALDPPQRREVAKELRKVAENFAGVPDG